MRATNTIIFSHQLLGLALWAGDVRPGVHEARDSSAHHLDRQVRPQPLQHREQLVPGDRAHEAEGGVHPPRPTVARPDPVRERGVEGAVELPGRDTTVPSPGDRERLATMIDPTPHLDWAVRIARAVARRFRFAAGSQEAADVEQTACLELCAMAARFDPAQVPAGGDPERAFRGYAAPLWGGTCRGKRGRRRRGAPSRRDRTPAAPPRAPPFPPWTAE